MDIPMNDFYFDLMAAANSNSQISEKLKLDDDRVVDNQARFYVFDRAGNRTGLHRRRALQLDVELLFQLTQRVEVFVKPLAVGGTELF